MSAFDDYLKTKNSQTPLATPAVTPTLATAPAPAAVPAVSAPSPFDAAIQNKNKSPFDVALQNKTPIKKVENAAGSSLRWLGTQLMKPVGAVEAVTEAVGNTIGGDTGALGRLPGQLVDVATGKRQRSFADLWREGLSNHPIAGTIIGTVIDIAADPLVYASGGLTELGDLAARVEKLTSAGKTIAEGSKLAEEVAKSGKTIEELSSLAKLSKTEQAAQGARSFLKAGNIPLVSAKTSEAAYKITGALGETVKAIPGVTKTLETGKSLFNTATKNETFNKVYQHFKNLGDFRKAQVLEEAKAIQNTIKGMKPEEIIQVSNYLEKGIIPDNPELLKIGDQLKKTYKNYIESESKVGIAGRQVENYAPHIPVKAPVAGGTENYLSPKMWSTSLGSAEKRDVLKFISESGKEAIGTAKGLGLSPVDTVKGLSHDITWGDFKSVQQVKDLLEKYGIKLTFKPQTALRGSLNGYFNPTSKEIVIASKRGTLEEVLSTLKHEITHSAQFQLAGNLDMMETYTKAGKYKYLSELLTGTKDSARTEWESILKSRGITPEQFKAMSGADKTYYKQPTELLARAMQTYREDPALAKQLFPKTATAIENLRRTNPMFDVLDTRIPAAGEKVLGDIFRGKNGELYQVASGTKGLSIAEANKAAIAENLPYRFQENPAVQLAIRGTSHAKAVTSAEFFHTIRDLAVKDGVEVGVPELKGLKFEPDVAKHIDAYYQSMQPKEVQGIFKAFDTVQNWWKGQALISPAYHIRNMVGNFWNNFLAGITDPSLYVDAGKVQLGKEMSFVDAAGKSWDSAKVLDAAKKSGVINQGWYAGDITKKITEELAPGRFNPLSQGNLLFQSNQKAGSVIENNARLANFIYQLKKGLPVDDAAMAVKKYLFDYTDLTVAEKNVFKRLMPFYTFTRKNLPLQLENLMYQPGKYAGIEKAVRAIETIGMAGAPKANEKYISDYIKNNTAMRINYNAKDHSYNYFLLGNWLPSYQAMDFLSQPLENIMGMLTPIIKTPIETLANTSSFWKNTLDEYQNIERYPGEQVNFLGINMPKKTAQILRNIRLLNDLDKLNPGSIFGGARGQKSIFAKAGLPAVNIPYVGNLSPSQYKYSASGTNPNAIERTAGFLSSKLTSYKPSSAREYYNQDTNTRAEEIKTAIKRAAATGDTARVNLLIKQLSDFLKQRGT